MWLFHCLWHLLVTKVASLKRSPRWQDDDVKKSYTSLQTQCAVTTQTLKLTTFSETGLYVTQF